MSYSIYPEDFKELKIRTRQNNCFLIMRFGKETDDVYKTIVKAAKYCGLNCDRSDTLTRSIPFFYKIVTSIVGSNYLIVDISGLNANVLYELGIAHTLRDAKNVFILKDEETECPSDLKHITYFQYYKNNLDELYQHVVNFFKSNNYMDNLIEILSLLDIIPENISNSKLRDFLESKLSNSCLTLYEILNKRSDIIDRDEIDFILLRLLFLYQNATQNNETNLRVFCMQLLLQTVNRLIKNYTSENFIKEVFGIDNSDKSSITELQIELASLLLAENTDNVLVYNWVKNYFLNSSPASIDVFRYKLQISLIRNNGKNIEKFIFEVLRNSKNNTLIEHMLNICTEKGLTMSISTALLIINNTDNPYVFRSAMDLITELGTFSEIMKMLSIVNSKQALVSQYEFINKHINKANDRLKNIPSTNS